MGRERENKGGDRKGGDRRGQEGRVEEKGEEIQEHWAKLPVKQQ